MIKQLLDHDMILDNAVTSYFNYFLQIVKKKHAHLNDKKMFKRKN